MHKFSISYSPNRAQITIDKKINCEPKTLHVRKKNKKLKMTKIDTALSFNYMHFETMVGYIKLRLTGT